LAYDLVMRRFVLCFLLCLMPLRLWAGVWMPMAQSASHHPAGSVQLAQAHSAHDCHEAVVEPMHHQAHGQVAESESALQKADCHDGSCLLCSVCHQSASLAVWPLMLPVTQAQAWPVGALWMHVAHTPAPLTKPPIS
jgi:hypothetical protein